MRKIYMPVLNYKKFSYGTEPGEGTEHGALDLTKVKLIKFLVFEDLF